MNKWLNILKHLLRLKPTADCSLVYTCQRGSQGQRKSKEGWSGHLIYKVPLFLNQNVKKGIKYSKLELASLKYASKIRSIEISLLMYSSSQSFL